MNKLSSGSGIKLGIIFFEYVKNREFKLKKKLTNLILLFEIKMLKKKFTNRDQIIIATK